MTVDPRRETGERTRCALAVELTYSCNQACAYCYNPGRLSPAGREPTTAEVLSRLERLLSAWQISTVTLTGGEPLRHSGLFGILDLLRARRTPTQMISNGTLVTSDLAVRLREYELGAIQITINGPNPELHRAHVGRDSFAEAIAGARMLLGLGLPVTGCIVVTRRNAEYVGEIVQIWRGLGVRRIALSRFSPAGMSLDRMKAWLPRRQDLITAFGQAKAFANEELEISCTVPVPACLFDTAEFQPIRFGQCAIGSRYQEFALGPDGALRLCTLHAGRLENGRDVLDPTWDLARVPRSAEVAGYRERIPPFCAGCSMVGSCLGGCGASRAFSNDGAPRTLDPLVEQYVGEDPTILALGRGRDGARLGVEP